ncbi:MarR family winged helix-turn-helix transcriptional regulator [Actinomadura rubrisoli]|uniref:MarR family transcriptional regulator n=1 Tax=Actinomadura rubrisoli TaxID=2530368 RepID=A0A4R5ABM4_9ACTN|nr:MarR family winged helix-turn-helix transcriptional regulator [Actinomadura rubrisoli]TDD69768.1 MarR family transcriptional regulator [Actinomadura rubrisoli]
MEATKTAKRERDLTQLLTLVERRVVSRLSAALTAGDCSIDEWRVLSLLADGRGHAMTEIADYAMLPPPTLTKLIDRMVSSNRVYRRVDDTDRRRVLVFLTPRGREKHTALSAVVDDESNRLAAAVGPEETALLSALLTRIAARLT